MLRFLLRQLAIIITSFVGISLLAFSLVRLAPGDTVTLLSGERGLSEERRASLSEQYGLDDSMPVQYLNYVLELLTGNFGESAVTHQPVLTEFWRFFPATVELSVAAMFFAISLGLTLGVVAAIKRNTWVDYTVSSTALLGYSMPIFWWGLLLVLFFSLTLGWTPVAGRLSYLYDIEPVTGFMLIDTLLTDEEYGWEAFRSALLHLTLPAIVLGTIPMAVIARMTRSSMIDVMSADYIRTAKAKGLSRARVIWIHGLRNALIPVVTVIGLQSSMLLTGAILTETIFSWPGIGKWILEAIYKRDYPSVQGGLMLISLFVIIVNAAIDLLYAYIDPRVRKQS